MMKTPPPRTSSTRGGAPRGGARGTAWEQLAELAQRPAGSSLELVPAIGAGFDSWAADAALAAAKDAATRRALASAKIGWSDLLARVVKRAGSYRAELFLALARAEGTPTLLWDSVVTEVARRTNRKASDAEAWLCAAVAEELDGVYDAQVCQAMRPEAERFLALGFRDVLSFNFDRVLCSRVVAAPGDDTRHPRESAVRLASTRSAPRIWYPHGHTSRPRSILLGARAYGAYVERLNRAFGDSMQRVRRGTSPDVPSTWVEVALERPLLFVGLSMSREEWPLWWLVTQRARRWARGDAPPAFVMTRASDTESFRTLQAASHLLGLHLLLVDDWSRGWQRLFDTLSV
jgi:hypothetical protein